MYRAMASSQEAILVPLPVGCVHEGETEMVEMADTDPCSFGILVTWVG